MEAPTLRAVSRSNDTAGARAIRSQDAYAAHESRDLRQRITFESKWFHERAGDLGGNRDVGRRPQ